MKTKLFYVFAAIMLSTNSFGQDRGNILYFDLYQFGSFDYKQTRNGNVTTDLKGLSANHIIYDLGFTLGNYYFRIDTSPITGVFFR